MASTYTQLFEYPGTLAFSVSGLIARMPISMTGIGIITMLSQRYDSYWLAGAVAATFTLTMALVAPQISRAVDKYGQSKVLPAATAVSVTSLLVLLLCAYLRLPNWALFISAVFSGCMPSMPAMVRARWTSIYRGDSRLHTAYSFESVLDEVCFIIGPPLSVGLSVALFPEAGPLLSVVLLILGVTLFVMQKNTEPDLQNDTAPNSESALKPLSMKVLVLTLVSLGTIVGAIDVISVAFAESVGEPVSASIVLSVYAMGSCLAGLLFGVMKLTITLSRQLILASLATAITTIPLIFVNSLFALSVTIFISGIFFSPAMIIAMGLAERIVPSSRLTEGLTWMITGLGTGVSLGAALSGWSIDHYGVGSSFYIALAAGWSVFIMAFICHWLLKNKHHPLT